MSLQVFLQAQISGTEEFLTAQPVGGEASAVDLTGRCAFLTLLCEVLPRALLAELKLSRMLLGTSSAEQFLLVLAEEDIPRADQFLEAAAGSLTQLSGNTLRLLWASTENLGPWPVARKRLDDSLAAKSSAPYAHTVDVLSQFAPFTPTAQAQAAFDFAAFGDGAPGASRVGWSPENPGHLVWEGGAHSWALREQSSFEEDGILFPRRFALSDSGPVPCSLAELAERSEGAAKWGILRGDVEQFDAQLHSLTSIEEHIHLSVLFKEFFAGELAVLCTLPDFWRKVSILYRGGDDFAVVGTWDALVLLARELQRLFEKFVEQNSEAFPSLAGRSISMALAIGNDFATPAATVFHDAGLQLRTVKASEPGSFHLFGRTLEWKRLPDAEELKTSLMRLVTGFRFPPAFIHDVASVYREAFATRGIKRGKALRIDKPWRTYMRLATVIPPARGKEANAVRTAVITNLVGKRTAGFKLRPSARVGLEWARLAVGSEEDAPRESSQQRQARRK
jgi:CRISPR-associated protein Csm1